MPNHVTNIIRLSGDGEKIAQMLEEIKYDDIGLGSIDFNKIIPMPEDLNIEESSVMIRGYDQYKQFIDVYTLYGSQNTDNLLNIPIENEDIFLRARKDIKSDEFALGKKAFQNEQKYGARSWYDWCIQNWGTKWNSYGYEDNLNYNAHPDSVRFETAWSAPHPVLEQLAGMHPDIEFEHKWADEDIGQNCGSRTYKNGIIAEEYCPGSNKEAIEFACAVKGYESPIDIGYALNSSQTDYINVWSEEYEAIYICGHPALFSDSRINDKNVPYGLYRYDLRHSDDGSRFVTVEPNVRVNFGGSIITAEKIDFGEKGFAELSEENSPNFLGYSVTVQSFMQGDFDDGMKEMKL